MTTGNYTCTVANDLGSTSMDIIVDSECEADSFTAEAGERQVTFSWCPPDDSNCTTHTLFFNISCYPPPSSPSSPLLISEPGTTTLDGFSPNTEYNCSIHTQSHYTVSFTTKEDCKSFTEFQVRSKEKILQMVTDLVVEQLQKICSECDSANIDREEIECTDQSPPTITYRARLGGTHANDSDDLVAELEKWAGEGQHLSLNDEPDSPESMELVGVAAGVSAGLISLVATMGAFLAVWRSRRSVRETKQAQELGMEELPRPERAPDELKETERDYSYVTVERNEGAEDGVNSGSPRDGSPTIDTRGNTAYLPVAPRDGRDRQYVEMPSRQKPEPQPSAGRRLPLTGITTTPNAAYFEISVDSLQYSATLPSRPMDPLYESVGDFTLWKDRAKRGVQQLLKSLPRYAAPQANNKPPHLPPSHPSRSQSLPRGNVAPPTAKEAPPTTKEAPPDPEDSPMRNRPPAPLPEEARESDEDDDDYVYERVVNND
ncbi:hypothetical protein GBAR_LOCUS16568 [Geodia barretti]|uniref:Uncharacterized protein n=1 Tax=Geodia barretti TaxID=519541 RepID=A0AA35SFQ1_GEOBA|nr:hypothetical protein GBAR_LOCUS16568 [Geodia barretti]